MSTVVAWNMKVGRREGVPAALAALGDPIVLGLMETAGHRGDIARHAASHGYSIVTGSGDVGASSQLLVKHGSGVVSTGVVTVPTVWRGPKGRRIGGRAFPWVKLHINGRPTLVILAHMPWNPVRNPRAWIACTKTLRRLVTINPAWDVLIVGDLNQGARVRLPWSILGTANKVGGRIVATGAGLDYGIFRRATTGRWRPRPIATTGKRGPAHGSDHPSITYRIGA